MRIPVDLKFSLKIHFPINEFDIKGKTNVINLI